MAGVAVAADAANGGNVMWRSVALAAAAEGVTDRRLSEHPLRHPDRVLAGTTGNVLDFEVLHNLGVDRHVLLLGEDLVVGVEAIPAAVAVVS